MNSRQGLTVLIVILLLGLAGTAYWAYSTHQKNNTLLSENETLNQQIADLTTLRDELQSDVDSLATAYSQLATENESLRGSAEETEKNVQKRPYPASET